MGFEWVGLHSYLILHFAYFRELVAVVIGPSVELWEWLIDFMAVFSKRTIEFAKYSDFIFSAYPSLLLSRR